MFAFSVSARRPLRVLCAVTALLAGSTFAGQRAEALSPINPGMSNAGKPVAGELIEVRGGHGGGGVGFSSGRGVATGSAVVRGGAIGAGVAGGPRFAGRPFVHRRHFHGVFIGGVYYDDYPYDDGNYYDYPPVYPDPAYVAGGGCRRVLTVHGPRVICHRAARHHRIHRRHHTRRHHRA